MSTAQQPRRVGGVKPGRNTAQIGASKYDSQEVPVLIRLPARATPSVEGDSKPNGQMYRYDSADTKSDRSHESKSARGQRRSDQANLGVNTKLVVGGVLAGVVVVCLLFFANGGSSDRTDDVAWPDEDGDVLVASDGVQVIIPEDSDPSPEFTYRSETVEAEPIPSDSIDTITAPNLEDVPALSELAREADGSTAGTAPTSWQEEPSTRLFPQGGGSNATQGALAWPTSDDRSSIDGTDSDVHRTGRLERSTSPSSSILKGTIEIPTSQTSLR